MSLKNEKIAVLFGGVSAEREVSLNSGKSVFEALQSLGYNVEAIDTKEFPIEKLKE
ncbi:D-alanine--D-alanine ligase, partial [Glaesserella parasuis]|nr:D-alanine--D-alanine ligase [Glaesserella parasuis]MDE3930279.1 D-alanine--D-alanine ligase [Glaesserella parasuis]MDE4027504.1 D-alanine--D-alanine ligase [Glaesserella parasuis]